MSRFRQRPNNGVQPIAAGLQELAEQVAAVLAARRSSARWALAGSMAASGPVRALANLTEALPAEPLKLPAEPLTLPGRRTKVDQPDPVAELVSEPSAEHAEIWELVRRAQRGDGEAFGRLYDRYVAMVFRYISLRVPDRGLAEDFTSETFLRGLRRIGSFSYQGRDIGAWFITIARNIVFDHSKSARARLEVSVGDLVDVSPAAEEPTQSSESAALDRFTSATLMAAIRQLNPEQRECVVFRFLHGFSVSETAAAMGKNDGAIKALQYRAVKKLADIVGDTLR